jgi:hypothetical protein
MEDAATAVSSVRNAENQGIHEMTVILVPANGGDVQINWFNWRPTVALLVRKGVLPVGERAERCLANGCGGYLTSQEAEDAAAMLASVLSAIKTGDRVMMDGSINDRPKDYSRPISEWDEAETWDHYSAAYEWLKTFEEFCRTSNGFRVY